jgi:hypothetical protein
MDKLAPFCKFIKSNDIEGDLGTTVGIFFDTAEEAEAFGEKFGVAPTVHTQKHVYSDWKPVLEKRGAFHPLMDPYKMEANKDIIPNYSVDMCPKSLDYLSRVVYVEIYPDWTTEELDAKVDAVKAALK